MVDAEQQAAGDDEGDDDAADDGADRARAARAPRASTGPRPRRRRRWPRSPTASSSRATGRRRSRRTGGGGGAARSGAGRPARARARCRGRRTGGASGGTPSWRRAARRRSRSSVQPVATRSMPRAAVTAHSVRIRAKARSTAASACSVSSLAQPVTANSTTHTVMTTAPAMNTRPEAPIWRGSGGGAPVGRRRRPPVVAPGRPWAGVTMLMPGSPRVAIHHAGGRADRRRPRPPPHRLLRRVRPAGHGRRRRPDPARPARPTRPARTRHRPTRYGRHHDRQGGGEHGVTGHEALAGQRHVAVAVDVRPDRRPRALAADRRLDQPLGEQLGDAHDERGDGEARSPGEEGDQRHDGGGQQGSQLQDQPDHRAERGGEVVDGSEHGPFGGADRPVAHDGHAGAEHDEAAADQHAVPRRRAGRQEVDAVVHETIVVARS